MSIARMNFTLPHSSLSNLQIAGKYNLEYQKASLVTDIVIMRPLLQACNFRSNQCPPFIF